MRECVEALMSASSYFRACIHLRRTEGNDLINDALKYILFTVRAYIASKVCSGGAGLLPPGVKYIWAPLLV